MFPLYKVDWEVGAACRLNFKCIEKHRFISICRIPNAKKPPPEQTLFTIRKEFTLPMAWMMEIKVEDCPNITLHRGKVVDLGIPSVKVREIV